MLELDPTAQRIVTAAGIIVGAAIVLHVVGGRWARGRRRGAVRRTLKKAQREAEARATERRRHAAKIVATSSTSEIAGYELVRQIEAVFVDGHKTPAQATEALKAVAGLKGGNAVINLVSERVPGGGCAVRGDAVIVRRIDQSPVTPRAVVIEDPPQLPPPRD